MRKKGLVGTFVPDEPSLSCLCMPSYWMFSPLYVISPSMPCVRVLQGLTASYGGTHMCVSAILWLLLEPDLGAGIDEHLYLPKIVCVYVGGCAFLYVSLGYVLSSTSGWTYKQDGGSLGRRESWPGAAGAGGHVLHPILWYTSSWLVESMEAHS